MNFILIVLNLYFKNPEGCALLVGMSTSHIKMLLALAATLFPIHFLLMGARKPQVMIQTPGSVSLVWQTWNCRLLALPWSSPGNGRCLEYEAVDGHCLSLYLSPLLCPLLSSPCSLSLSSLILPSPPPPLPSLLPCPLSLPLSPFSLLSLTLSNRK